VDDHPVARDGLATWVSTQSDLDVCGGTDDPREAIELVKQLRPDVVVVDVVLNDGNGIDLVAQIRAAVESTRVLVWSMYDEKLYAERALRAGAMGFVNKRQAATEIVDAIRWILQDRLYFSQSVGVRVLGHGNGSPDADSIPGPLDGLSNRELEIFQLIGQGLATTNIAEKMHLSVKTIETYRQRIKRKMGIKDGLELTRRAIQWVLENG
jgi:DNA-binding NarL/FixJ family response regulator